MAWLRAFAPTDPAKLKNPSTLIFAYSPVENPTVYQAVYTPFMDYLAACTGKKMVYFPVQSNAAQVEAMRSGRLHISGFSTGVVGFAVNLAGAIPFAMIGSEKGAGGIGVALDAALNNLYWDQVGLILAVIFTVVILTEGVTTAIRSRIL